MNYLYIIALQLVSSLLIFAEMIIPSFGIFSIIAAAGLFYSYFLLYTTSPALTPILIILNLFTVPLVIVASLRYISISPAILKGSSSHPPQSSDIEIGEEGVAETALRPSGKVVFPKGTFHVIADGNYIDEGTTVRVTKTDSNLIVVTKM